MDKNSKSSLPWYKKYAEYRRKQGVGKYYRQILDREEKEIYLERFYLLPRWLTLGLFQIVIHRFWKSDSVMEDGLHDHPWDFAVRLLEGSYTEYTLHGINYHRPGYWRYQKAEMLHAIELFKNPDGTEKEVWTLFLMFRRRREWGFVNGAPIMWKHWREWIYILRHRRANKEFQQRFTTTAEPEIQRPEDVAVS